MEQYLTLLEKVRKQGKHRPSRAVLKSTGQTVDTLSTFGEQLRFDLSKGFPAVTTKKLFFKGIVHELLWFLKGSTNVAYLKENKVGIWDEWIKEGGELGPVYGWNWRRWGKTPPRVPQPPPTLRAGVTATYLGIACGTAKENSFLKKTWEGMIERCYDPKNISYSDYGEKGVSVCDRWLEFQAFAADAPELPGWHNKKDNPRGFVLDKDGLGTGFLYSPKTCQWITPAENAALSNTKVYTVEKKGQQYRFTNISRFCQEQEIDSHNFSDLWTGNKNAKERSGFRLISVEDTDKGIDQIANVIEELKKNPNSRRLIVSAWDVGNLPYMALPPCHLLWQLYAQDGRLSCHLYQRSADIFLGVPFNIASYALLTSMIAQVTGLLPGEFVHTFGDLHAYANHLEQIDLQLSRSPLPAPTLWLNPDIKDIDEFTFDDIRLENYQSHPHIKAEVAV